MKKVPFETTYLEEKFIEDFIETYKKDAFYDALWVEFNDAVNDPEDSRAIKDLNNLAWKMLLPDRDENKDPDIETGIFTASEKALINSTIITLCGSGLDTLLQNVKASGWDLHHAELPYIDN